MYLDVYSKNIHKLHPDACPVYWIREEGKSFSPSMFRTDIKSQLMIWLDLNGLSPDYGNAKYMHFRHPQHGWRKFFHVIIPLKEKMKK